MKKPTREQMLRWRKAKYDRIRRDPGEDNIQRDGSALKQIEVMTRGEVAEALDISRQAVHQIERNAIRKIRNYFRKHLAEVTTNE